ncbi:MAG: glycoside hydrolase family 38 C-terminal domain-containing protein [Elusimicrobiota bacterium]
MSQKVNAALSLFIGKINKLKRYNEYKVLYGIQEGLETKKYAVVDSPYIYSKPTWKIKWPQGEPDMWLKGEVIFPNTIAGISLTGANAVLKHTTATGSKVYINGKKMVDEKWWFYADLPLINDIVPGTSVDISIRYTSVDGNKFQGIPTIFIDKVETVLRRVETFCHTVNFIELLISKGKVKDKKTVAVFNKVLEQIPFGLLENDEPEKFVAALPQLEHKLKVFAPLIKKYAFYLMGHAHIDMNWLWDWENTVETTMLTFKQVSALAADYPEFKFSQSQAVLYKTIEDRYPDLFKRVQELVKQGRWDVTASTWVENDINMSSGEALIRQTLYAKKYTREKFGVTSRICWCPDTFGHPWSYPQILKKCGIDYYYFCRCGKGYPLFRWEGIDGSSVLAFNDVHGYNGSVQSGLYRSSELLINSGSPTKDYLISYGVGDHGGGPTRRDLIGVGELQNNKLFPEVKLSGTHEYFDIASKKAGAKVPVVKSELQYIFEGCYTTQANIKKQNRTCENALVTAETLASLARMYGCAYPADEFVNCWQDTCFNQFHDILDGSGIYDAYEYSTNLANNVLAKTGKIARGAEKFVVSLIDFTKVIPPKREGKDSGIVPVVVFNPLSFTRSSAVEVSVAEVGTDTCSIEDINGKIVPSQVVDDKLVFLASNVPPMGYKTFVLKKGCGCGTSKDAVPADVISNVFENEQYKLVFDRGTGSIISLYDKKGKKELVFSTDQANMFKLYHELPRGMSAWYLGRTGGVENLVKNTKVVSTVKGDVADVIKTETIFGHSKIWQTILFYKHNGKIEFRTKVDWQEPCGQEIGIPALRVSFPMNIESSSGVYEIPFAAVERPSVGQEAPALRWVDISDGNHGVAVLNDCKYGYNVRGNNIELTLLRNAYDPAFESDKGVHEFIYALYPHTGDWRTANVVNHGYELNNPLRSVVVNQENVAGDDKKGLPLNKSFVSASAGNVIISALKKAEDGDGYILHAYETQGNTHTPCVFKFGVKVLSVIETNLIEENSGSISGKSGNKRIQVRGNAFTTTFKKWEIKSFRLIV